MNKLPQLFLKASTTLKSILLIPVLLILLNACTSTSPIPTATLTPSTTPSFSPAQLTAALTYRPTLPASFTPTFTPTATYTPSFTPTPTITPTPTTVPEQALCQDFVSAIAGGNSTETVLVQLSNRYRIVVIHLRLIFVETEEILAEADLPGGNTYTLQFQAAELPFSGEYRWEASLADDNRAGMCLRYGTFTLIKPEASAELTAEATVEITAEITVEVTAEVTAEITPELTPETTIEVTEEAE